MTARLRKLLTDVSETFWVFPGSLVLLGIVAAFGLTSLDRSGKLPEWLLQGWLYDGGATGARTLLGAVVSSTIGVAGTVFSITIAALSLAAGQMGPRLLRNFVRDRGNQLTLGAFLGTFAYALIVLRSVRTEAEGEFVPHLSLSIAIVLAIVCVAMLVYFVGHMAGRINVDTVIELVSDDLGSAIRRLTVDKRQPDPPPREFWSEATVRQLVEVAVRALSPGINDPHTAVSVIDRLGAALCAVSPLHLPSGVWLHEDRPVLVVPNIQYDELLNSMFHSIRQSASGNTMVLIRQLEVLTQVVAGERDRERMAGLKRHANLIVADAERCIGNPSDLNDVRRRYELFVTVMRHGPLGPFAG